MSSDYFNVSQPLVKARNVTGRPPWSSYSCRLAREKLYSNSQQFLHPSPANWLTLYVYSTYYMRASRHVHEPTLQSALFSSNCAGPPAVAGFSTLDTMELTWCVLRWLLMSTSPYILISHSPRWACDLWPQTGSCSSHIFKQQLAEKKGRKLR
jgi:hypothetical protein